MVNIKQNKLIEALEECDGVVELSGYMSKTDDNLIRVYPKLNVKICYEISANDIVHVIYSNKDHEPSSLFVSDKAEIKVITKIKAATLQRKPVDDTRVPTTCSDKSYDTWIKCLEGGGSIDHCIALSRRIELICEIGDILTSTPGPAKK